MNGSYGLVEIKLGGETLIKDGVATLIELAGKIDTELPCMDFKSCTPLILRAFSIAGSKLKITTEIARYSYKKQATMTPLFCRFLFSYILSFMEERSQSD